MPKEFLYAYGPQVGVSVIYNTTRGLINVVGITRSMTKPLSALFVAAVLVCKMTWTGTGSPTKATTKTNANTNA
jgi:hypothetical protein